MTDQPQYTAGFRDRLFDKDPFPLAIWYPAATEETAVRHMGVASSASRNAAFSEGGPFPMVVFSRNMSGTITLIHPMRGN